MDLGSAALRRHPCDGQRPVGIYVIDDRYAAVADSNANALLIVTY